MAPNPPVSGRRIQTRRSGVHGKGVFAVQDIAEGERIVEYVGEIIGWDEAQDRHPHDLSQPNHTFYFHIDADRVIDAKYGGNSSRWINHSCDPNCEADEQAGRIFIRALLRPLARHRRSAARAGVRRADGDLYAARDRSPERRALHRPYLAVEARHVDEEARQDAPQRLNFSAHHPPLP